MPDFIINAVIVTYNRRELLLRCVQSVLIQSVKVNTLYIIDNASTDGTYEFLTVNGIPLSPLAQVASDNIVLSALSSANAKIKGIDIHYLRLMKNKGGAGGFYEGMKAAFIDKPDFIWIMDDDGYPSANCLEKQLEFSDFYDYVMPISLDPEKKDMLTWFIRKKNKRWTRSYYELRKSFNDGIMYAAVPFNGLLMSRKLIERVGYPKKEMFIWGDDFEHQYRCIKAGFSTVTALDAVFFHPEDKAGHDRIFFGLIPVNYTDSRLRFTCLIRNSTYNYWNYKGKGFVFAKFLIYTWFFLIKRHFDIKNYLYYLKCVRDGIKGDFTRHLQFLK